MKRYPYFKTQPCLDGTPAPAPLECTTERIVRFDEVDAMEIVWHGRYASYFEDARVMLGEKYGIGYKTLMREKTPAPVKQMYVNYHSPLVFGERCYILATMHWTEAARMNFSYKITGEQGNVVATGYTVQMFTAEDRVWFTEQPTFYAEFCHHWKNGTLSPQVIA